MYILLFIALITYSKAVTAWKEVAHEAEKRRYLNEN